MRSKVWKFVLFTDVFRYILQLFYFHRLSQDFFILFSASVFFTSLEKIESAVIVASISSKREMPKEETKQII